MFEFDQQVVSTLLSEDSNFKRLYDKHNELKETVNQANHGELTIDDLALETLKKQKLMLKDQMADLIKRYRDSEPLHA